MLLDLPIELLCHISSFLGNDIRFLFTYKILYTDELFWKNLITTSYSDIKEVNYRTVYLYLKNQLRIRDKVQFIDKNLQSNEAYWKEKLNNEFKIPAETFRDLYLLISKKVYLKHPTPRMQFFSNFKNHCELQNHQKCARPANKNLRRISV